MVWVRDDASTDQTPITLDELERELPSLRVVRAPTNSGIAENSSELLSLPEAEFIIRLDSDDLLEPGYVASVVEQMVRHPTAGWAHTAVIEIDEDGTVGRTRRIARATGFQPADRALRGSLRGYRTAANIVTFRRAALAGLNYYRGRPEFVEDYDLSVRMADAGWGNVYIDEPLARYRIWSDTRGVRAKRKGLQLRGYARIFDEALIPAWSRRGWSLRPVRRRRRRLAAEHCASCFAPQYTERERDALVGELRALGDGPALRARLVVCRAGGAPLLARLDALPYRARSLVKAVIRRFRS